MRIHSYNREGKTKLQWEKEGRILKADAKGELMWINSYRQDTAMYYLESETRLMTARDKKKLEKKKKEERKLKAKIRAEKKEQERIQKLVDEALEKRRQYEIGTYRNKQLGKYVKRYDSVSDMSGGLVIEVKSNGDYIGFDHPDLELQSLTMLSLDGKVSIHIQDYTECTLEDINQINQALDSASCYIAYNCSFHLNLLKKYKFMVRECPTFCVMDMYSIMHSCYSDYWEHYTWCKQSTCAGEYNIRYSRQNADVDANMVRFCFPMLMGEIKTAFIDENKECW